MLRTDSIRYSEISDYAFLKEIIAGENFSNKIKNIKIKDYYNLDLNLIKKISFKDLFYYYDISKNVKNFENEFSEFYSEIYFNIKKIEFNFENNQRYIKNIRKKYSEIVKKYDFNIVKGNNLNIFKIKLKKGDNYIFLENIINFTIIGNVFYKSNFDKRRLFINVSEDCFVIILKV